MLEDERRCHDIRNQLGIILGFSWILIEEAEADDPRRGDFEEIHKAATTALELLSQLSLDRSNPAA